ncbi:uncharacterized protein J8A68_005661 [[Candida] subhashii]|uniref:Formamidopyrimidine-DNA glycosylase catalytic domain-containing protein n=1 Tax=[Candida] subhashii TaxID=561895 RepID=A0A8J5UV65_9ASCO|nr:uncharacterized protein J8A68_005661 [[Candida] subhashii]KAG7660844.1 hypothetical protein J8A68_005661 [[Candida] subhashii]
MPEVAEVAHICALLRRNIIGYKINKLILQNDSLLFPILKQSNDPIKELNQLNESIVNSIIYSIGRHGKYFWIRLKNINNSTNNEQGILLMHFGMTGMIKIKNISSHLIFMENGGDKKVLKSMKNEELGEEDIEVKKDDEWPPRFTKFEMILEKEGKQLELAFTDPRRLGRIRFLTGDSIGNDNDLLKMSPLDVLGPDYSKSSNNNVKQDKFEFGDPDPDTHGRPRLDIKQFNKLVLSKKKPIKSLLLDQTCFAGVGNWVADEIIFQARLHPEEVLSSKVPYIEDASIDPIVQKLYDSIIYVCEECVRVEGDVTKFPKHWLMIHRWGKARKSQPKPKTGDGYTVDHITVGGRTSCYCPEIQKLLPKLKHEEEEQTSTSSPQPKTIKRRRIKKE